MIRYLIKRIFWLVPTLILVTMATFFLSNQGKSTQIASNCLDLGAIHTPPGFYYDCVMAERKKQGLDKAPFFVGVRPLSEPDTMFLFIDPLEQEAVEKLCWAFGNWPLIQEFRITVRAFLEAQNMSDLSISQLTRETSYQFQDLREISISLLRNGSQQDIERSLEGLNRKVSELHSLRLDTAFSELNNAWNLVKNEPTRWKTFVPVVSWHGLNTQYLDWLSAVIFRFDFGKNEANVTVAKSIKSLLPNTLLFTGMGILFSFLISIPLAIWSARNVGRKRERAVGLGLFMLDSVPSFWLALMLLIFLADPEYLGWFPSSYEPDSPPGRRLYSMILPLFAYTYGSLAFLTRTLRSSLLEVRQAPFVQTVRAMGYSEGRILWRHTLRPALLPLITVIGAVFPLLVGGSVILEGLFNIQGLGYTILKSTLNNEQSIILAVFTLSAIMTLLGYFVSDILYAWADPRIRLHQQSQST